MNKLVKLCIADYLGDKSDTRLEILVNNLNPEFQLNKKSKSHVKLLLDDYEKSPDKSRLSLVEKYVGNVVIPIKKTKTIDNEYTRISNEMTELGKQIKDAKSDEELSRLKPKYERLENELMVEISKRDKVVIDPDRGEKRMIAKMFGDVTNEDSMAFKILNGLLHDFQMRTSYDPAAMIKKLFRINNKEPYSYSAGLIDPIGKVWRVTKGQGLESYNQGNKKI